MWEGSGARGGDAVAAEVDRGRGCRRDRPARDPDDAGDDVAIGSWRDDRAVVASRVQLDRQVVEPFDEPRPGDGERAEHRAALSLRQVHAGPPTPVAAAAAGPGGIRPL